MGCLRLIVCCIMYGTDCSTLWEEKRRVCLYLVLLLWRNLELTCEDHDSKASFIAITVIDDSLRVHLVIHGYLIENSAFSATIFTWYEVETLCFSYRQILKIIFRDKH